MKYQRIVALVDEGSAEIAAAHLGVAGFAVEIIDQSTIEKPPVGRVGLVVYGEESGAEAKLAEVRALLAGAGVQPELSTSISDEDNWRDAWKAFFKPRPVGRFTIVPSWEKFEPHAGDVVIHLDPGRAFGTGGHASTRLCLRALDEAKSCCRFLDVGCGSGILAVACALRWPEATGVAVDVDPEAIAVTVENAEKNAVTARIDARATPLAEVAGRFDVVCANIQADVLTQLAPDLAARLEPGGVLILSGILVEQGAAVAEAMAQAGLVLACTRDEEEWTALTFAPSP